MTLWGRPRKKVYRKDGICPQCGERPNAKTHRYCRICKAAYQRVFTAGRRAARIGKP